MHETLEEINRGADALTQWFASQETSDAVATLIMLEYLARCMVNKTTDSHKLAMGISLMTEALTVSCGIKCKEKDRQS